MLHVSSMVMQVFVLEEKMFTLLDIDECMKRLNLRYSDGDKPSTLAGISLLLEILIFISMVSAWYGHYKISLHTRDSNLHQHGECMVWSL